VIEEFRREWNTLRKERDFYRKKCKKMEAQIKKLGKMCGFRKV
jgi:hypothetical protein